MTLYNLTRQDIEQQFRVACDDLYVSTLKPPVIVDSTNRESALNKDLPKHLNGHIPNGFFIDPRMWRVYLDVGSIPPSLKRREEILAFIRSLCHHELTHFTLCPASRRLEVKLLLAAFRGFTSRQIKDDPALARSFAFMVHNLFADFVGDGHLACLGYGKNKLGPLTVWRERVLVTHSATKGGPSPSPLWKVHVALQELIWNEDLGLSRLGTLQEREKMVVHNLLRAVGTDWSCEETWAEKIGLYAAALEPLLLELEIDGSHYVVLPPDLAELFPDPTDSPIGSPPDSLDDQTLLDLLEQYGDDPRGFAGCLSALAAKKPGEALKLMYRARARELTLRLEEIRMSSESESSGMKTDWLPGDPLSGKGGLKLYEAVAHCGRPIPWVNTWKGSSNQSQRQNNSKAIYDLLLIIDSSGSMSWRPFASAPGRRGRYDRAALAGEAAALYAIEHGAKVAVINFSGDANVRDTGGYIRRLSAVEEVLLTVSGGGTVFPAARVEQLISMAGNPLLTVLLSDCELYNDEETRTALQKAVTRYDRLCVFQTCSGPLCRFSRDLAAAGAETYAIESPSDLLSLVIGRVAKQYVSFDENDWLKVGDEDEAALAG